MLSLFSRRKPSRDRSLAVVAPEGADHGAGEAPRTCALAACGAGARATILEMRCGDSEACRLRALGVCEGAHVNVVETRHAMLLDVRGTRLALGRAITAGITVQPLSS